MFNGLAGFIFGNKSPSSDAETIDLPAGREKNCFDNTNKAINATLAKNDSLEVVDGDDDEWLMVDVRRGNRTTPEPVIIDDTPVELDLLLPIPDGSSGESSPTADERGWNLTPPPCFTASFQREKTPKSDVSLIFGDENQPKGTPFASATKFETSGDDSDEIAVNTVLETSNFENLLIEHPSMSVYGRISHKLPRRRCETVPAGIVVVTQGFKQPLPLPASTQEEKPNGASSTNVKRETATVSEVLFDVELSVASRRVDIAKQQQAERAIKTKAMGSNRIRRSNATVFAPSQGNASPRRRRMRNHPAGRCNDRKCQ